MKQIALIGLGTMGGGMARRLLAAQLPLVVYNRSRNRAEQLKGEGAKVADTPGQAAADADVVISMVADDAASRSVWLGNEGVLAAAKSGTVFVESSTLSPGWVRELADATTSKGCTLLDAPVTGSKMQAERGELLFLVGGESKVLEQIRPVLEPMSRGVLHMGPTGSGAIMKLINNFLCGVQAASLGEALALTERVGIDLDKAVKVLTEGAPGSPLVKTLSDRMVARNYEVHFDLNLMAKDLAYASDLGDEAGLQLRTAQAALELFHHAADFRQEKRDMAAVVEPLRAQNRSVQSQTNIDLG